MHMSDYVYLFCFSESALSGKKHGYLINWYLVRIKKKIKMKRYLSSNWTESQRMTWESSEM